MLTRNAMAVAIGGLSMLTACSTLWGPDPPAVPKRAGTIEPVVKLRDSRGVDSEAMYRIGRYFQGQARYDDAAVAYRKALALDPANAEALNALGVVYSIQGRSDEAERAFKSAIAMSPGLSHLHSNLGYHYLQAGRNEAARTELREAIRLNPANAWAWSNLTAAEARFAAAVAPAVSAAQPSSPPAAAIAAQENATPLPGAHVPPLPAERESSPLVASVENVAVAPVVVPTPPTTVPAAAVAPKPETIVPALTSPPAVDAPQPASVVAPTSEASAQAQPIAGTVEVSQVAPVARLVGLAPNIWELRPRNLEPLARRSAAPQAAPLIAEHLPAAGMSPGIRMEISSSNLPATDISPRIRIEISNGNGVTALAKSVGRYLRALGASQARLTNQKPFDQRRTEIQYVPGMDDSAKELRKVLDTPAELVQRPSIDRGAHLRLVLGKDFHEIEAVARLRQEAVKPVLLAREAGRK